MRWESIDLVIASEPFDKTMDMILWLARKAYSVQFYVKYL